MRTGTKIWIALALLAGSPAMAGGVKIYSDELLPPPFTKLLFGYDRDTVCTVSGADCTANGDDDCGGGLNDFCGVGIDSLTPGTQTDIWDIVCNPLTPGGDDCQASSWDFSGNNLTNFPGMKPYTSTVVEITAAETCSSGKCGFSPSTGKLLGREDRGDGAERVPTVNALELEEREPQDHTIWLRAAVRREGVPASAGLGKGESRICYEQSGVPEVPLWQFPSCDLDGCFLQLGDSWEPENATTGNPEAFDCDNTIFNEVCADGGSCGFGCAVNSYADGDFVGKFSGDVINEGTVTLPSGHTYRALVARTVAEFNTSAFGGCIFPSLSEGVRTVVYLWAVPGLGTVVRLQSTTRVPDAKDFGAGEDILSEMDIKFGLFPPRSVTVGTVTSSSVQLTWDPGLIPDADDRIDEFRVYWDTDSGADSGYTFDSVLDPGDVSFSTNGATISGLSPGTTYHFTVTAVSTFSDQSVSGSTTYESALFPEQIPALPVDLPLEVTATTTGGAGFAGAVPDGDETPGQQLTVDKAGSQLALTWGASCQAGAVDYAIYEGTLGTPGSLDPVECSTSGATSFPITPAGGDRFYVVVPLTASAEGSYGIDSDDNERAASGSACLPQVVGNPVCP